MAEKQQDLIRRPAELTHEPLQGSEYFSRISLGDIYGKTTLKPGIQITTDIPYEDAMKWHNAIVNHDPILKEIADRYGIPHAASLSSEWAWGRDESGKFGNLVKNQD